MCSGRATARTNNGVWKSNRVDNEACVKNTVSVETIQLCNVAAKMSHVFSSEIRIVDQDQEARRRRLILCQNDDILVEKAVQKLVVENRDYLSLLTNVQAMAVEMETIAIRSRDMKVANKNMRDVVNKLRSQLDIFDSNAEQIYSHLRGDSRRMRRTTLDIYNLSASYSLRTYLEELTAGGWLELINFVHLPLKPRTDTCQGMRKGGDDPPAWSAALPRAESGEGSRPSSCAAA